VISQKTWMSSNYCLHVFSDTSILMEFLKLTFEEHSDHSNLIPTSSGKAETHQATLTEITSETKERKQFVNDLVHSGSLKWGV
jgi:hypothetical protein